MSKDTGGPAFPSIAPEFDGLDSDGGERWENGPQGGMTLRDYFAGQWLATIAIGPGTAVTPAQIATDCYRMADAMLAERAK